MIMNVLSNLSADDGSNDAGIAEEQLRSVLESPLEDTKLPLGADVTVSRVVIQDFDECASDEHNDCSAQVIKSKFILKTDLKCVKLSSKSFIR